MCSKNVRSDAALAMPINTTNHMHCSFVCFVALRPKLTAMVREGRSVHLTTLFPEKA